MGRVSVSSCRCCIFVSCVHPVAVLNVAFCMTYSLLMLVEDVIGDHTEEGVLFCPDKNFMQVWLYVFLGCPRICVCGCDCDVVCVGHELVHWVVVSLRCKC